MRVPWVMDCSLFCQVVNAVLSIFSISQSKDALRSLNLGSASTGQANEVDFIQKSIQVMIKTSCLPNEYSGNLGVL